jgi:hypothetical protein
MRMMERFTNADDTASALNKLARTFAAQVEALKRYRTGGEQSVAGSTCRSATAAKRSLAM